MIQQVATVAAGLEKVRQGWRLVKPFLLGILVVLVMAGAILALYYVPKMQVPVCPPGQDGLPPKICFDIENEARKTLAYILGGILAIIGIYMAHRRIRALERQVLVAQEGQITERFTRAIEQLGSEEIAIRLGGIYALERIANDSDKDYWAIMETLTAYVRENAPWRKAPPEAPGAPAGTEAVGEEMIIPVSSASPAPAAAPKPATDIQAVLTILGRRKYRYRQVEEKGRLDLTNTDLRGARLNRACLEGADLRRAHLEEADLWGIHLEGADLALAHLKGANLTSVHMEGADLTEAHLEKAILCGSHLEGSFLGGAHFEGDSYFIKVHLEGANLKDATGLTREKLTEAILDETTILPDYLQGQSSKAKGRKLNIRCGPGMEYSALQGQRQKGNDEE